MGEQLEKFVCANCGYTSDGKFTEISVPNMTRLTESLHDLYSRITYPILMRLYGRGYPND